MLNSVPSSVSSRFAPASQHRRREEPLGEHAPFPARVARHRLHDGSQNKQRKQRADQPQRIAGGHHFQDFLFGHVMSPDTDKGALGDFPFRRATTRALCNQAFAERQAAIVGWAAVNPLSTVGSNCG